MYFVALIKAWYLSIPVLVGSFVLAGRLFKSNPRSSPLSVTAKALAVTILLSVPLAYLLFWMLYSMGKVDTL